MNVPWHRNPLHGPYGIKDEKFEVPKALKRAQESGHVAVDEKMCPKRSRSYTVQIRGRYASRTSSVEIVASKSFAKPIYTPSITVKSPTDCNNTEQSPIHLFAGTPISKPSTHGAGAFNEQRFSEYASLARTCGPHVIPYTSLVIDHMSVSPHTTAHAPPSHTHSQSSPDPAHAGAHPPNRVHSQGGVRLPPAPPVLRLLTHAHTDHLKGLQNKTPISRCADPSLRQQDSSTHFYPVLTTPITASLLCGRTLTSPAPHISCAQNEDGAPLACGVAAATSLYTYVCGGARVTGYYPVLLPYYCQGNPIEKVLKISTPTKDVAVMKRDQDSHDHDVFRESRKCGWLKACSMIEEEAPSESSCVITAPPLLGREPTLRMTPSVKDDSISRDVRGNSSDVIDLEAENPLSDTQAIESDDDVVVVAHHQPQRGGVARSDTVHLIDSKGSGSANNSPNTQRHNSRVGCDNISLGHESFRTPPAPSFPTRDNPDLRVACLRPVPLCTLRALIAAAEAAEARCDDLDVPIHGRGYDDTFPNIFDTYSPKSELRTTQKDSPTAADKMLPLPPLSHLAPLPVCPRHAITVSPLHTLLFLNCLPAPAAEPCICDGADDQARAADASALEQEIMSHPAQFGCSGHCLLSTALRTHESVVSCHTCHPHVLLAVLPANHCPGSAIFAIRTHRCTTLHTGDLRYSAALHRQLLRLLGPVDAVYMDATFTHHRVLLPAPVCGQMQVKDHIRAFVHTRLGGLAAVLLPHGCANSLQTPITNVKAILSTAAQSMDFLYLLLSHQCELRALLASPNQSPASNSPPASHPTPPSPTQTPSGPHTILPLQPLAALRCGLLGPLDCLLGVGALGHELVLLAAQEALMELRRKLHAQLALALAEYEKETGPIDGYAPPALAEACLVLDYQQSLLIRAPFAGEVIASNSLPASRGDISRSPSAATTTTPPPNASKSRLDAHHWLLPHGLSQTHAPRLQPLLPRSHMVAARRLCSSLHTLSALADAHEKDANCDACNLVRSPAASQDALGALAELPCPPRRAFVVAHKAGHEAATLAPILSESSRPSPTSTPLPAQLRSSRSLSKPPSPNPQAGATSASSMQDLLVQLSRPRALTLRHLRLYLALLLLSSPPRAVVCPVQGLYTVADRACRAGRLAVGPEDARRSVGAQVRALMQSMVVEGDGNGNGIERACRHDNPANEHQESDDDDDDDDCVVINTVDSPLRTRPFRVTSVEGRSDQQPASARDLERTWLQMHGKHFPVLFEYYWGSKPIARDIADEWNANCAHHSKTSTDGCSETHTSLDDRIKPNASPSLAAPFEALFYVGDGEFMQPDHVFNRLLLLLVWLEMQNEQNDTTKSTVQLPDILAMKFSAMSFAQRAAQGDTSIYMHPPTAAHVPYNVSVRRSTRLLPALHDYMEDLRSATYASYTGTQGWSAPERDVMTAVMDGGLVKRVCFNMHGDYRGAIELLAVTRPRLALAVCDGFPEAREESEDEDM